MEWRQQSRSGLSPDLPILVPPRRVKTQPSRTPKRTHRRKGRASIRTRRTGRTAGLGSVVALLSLDRDPKTESQPNNGRCYVRLSAPESAARMSLVVGPVNSSGRVAHIGSLHSFLARIGTMNLPRVKFVVEHFSADVVPFRHARKSALKRSTTNHDRSGCCSTIPRFMERMQKTSDGGSSSPEVHRRSRGGKEAILGDWEKLMSTEQQSGETSIPNTVCCRGFLSRPLALFAGKGKVPAWRQQILRKNLRNAATHVQILDRAVEEIAGNVQIPMENLVSLRPKQRVRRVLHLSQPQIGRAHV